MPLDNTDVASLGSLSALSGPTGTDLIPIYRPGSPTPLQNASLSSIAAAVGGGFTFNAGTGLSGSGGATVTNGQTLSLANTAVTPGTYGDASHVAVPTVDQQGRITGISSVAITFPSSSLVVKDHGTTRTSAAASLNFAQGFAVADVAGAETITTIFASVKDYGAAGDGTTDDTTAFTNAAAAGLTIFVPPGTYKLTGNVTFAHEVVFLEGASISPATATIIAFNGGLRAPLSKLFNLTGTAAISFAAAKQQVAYAEWWGATQYSAASYPVVSPTYSDVAIQAAINSGASVVQLMGADYYISAAIAMLNNHQVLQGVAAGLYNTVGASRLIINSATIDGVTVGPSSRPAGTDTSNWLDHARVAHMVIRRSVAPTSIQNTSGFNGYQTSPTGLRLRWAVQCMIEDVTCIDHTNGFYVTGTASCVVRDCWAERYVASNGSGFDYFHGFSQDNTPATPFVSGNASMYNTFNAVNNSGGAFSGGTWGMYIYGGFSDSFVHGLETALCAVGFEAAGTGTTGTSPVAEDLKLTNGVFDGCTSFGIRVTNGNLDTQALVSACYVACTSGTCLQVDSCQGTVAITGNQLFAGGASITGIAMLSSTGVTSMNNIITDCLSPVAINGCVCCRTEDNINNSARSANQGVFIYNASARIVAKPVINGASSGMSGLGIKVDSGVGYCEVSPSGINPGSLTAAAAANKIVYNGTQITVSGAFGTTNYAMPGVYA